MRPRIFLDTNVLLYADDRDAGRKRQAAGQILREALGGRTGVVSTQVLAEYFVNATEKLGIAAGEVRRGVEVLRSLDVAGSRPRRSSTRSTSIVFAASPCGTAWSLCVRPFDPLHRGSPGRPAGARREDRGPLPGSRGTKLEAAQEAYDAKDHARIGQSWLYPIWYLGPSAPRASAEPPVEPEGSGRTPTWHWSEIMAPQFARVALILLALMVPSHVFAQEQDKGELDPVAKKLKAAVAAGKLTEAQAKAKWDAIQKKATDKKATDKKATDKKATYKKATYKKATKKKKAAE